jgi:putative membrane protein
MVTSGHGAHGNGADLGAIAVAAFAVLVVAYVIPAIAERRSGGRGWPAHRIVLWVLGVGLVAATMLGPVADAAHNSLPVHMASHLVAGMLAPLLLVMSAPVTLALRTLDVVPARRLSRLLRSAPARFLAHPVPAAVINVGSLWVLYATPLGESLLSNAALHPLLLAHFLAAGYLFTVSIVSVDPAPHRASFAMRLGVVVASIAAHTTLAKQIYASPPAGVPVLEAEQAGMVMYYGGDLLEIALLVVLFAQWYRRSSPTGRAPQTVSA